MLLTMVQQMGERQHRLLIHFININAHIYRQVYLGDPHAKRDAVQQRLELDFRPRDYGARYTSLRPACRQALFIDWLDHRQRSSVRLPAPKNHVSLICVDC